MKQSFSSNQTTRATKNRTRTCVLHETVQWHVLLQTSKLLVVTATIIGRKNNRKQETSLRPCSHSCVFKGMRFRCDRKRIDRIASNYNFDAFSTLPTKTFENDRIARSDVSWTLCAGYKDTRLRYFRSSFSFWCVFDRFRPSTLIRYECVFKVTHFQERFQIDAFSMKTLSVLVWTESLNVSNVCVLKGKRASVDRAYVQHLHFRYST